MIIASLMFRIYTVETKPARLGSLKLLKRVEIFAESTHI